MGTTLPPHTHTWGTHSFWVSNMLHKQDMPHHTVPWEVTCFSCFKGQTFDHISNPTHSGTMNQGFRSCKSDCNFPKFPKHTRIPFFFFNVGIQILFHIYLIPESGTNNLFVRGYNTLECMVPFSLHISYILGWKGP